VLYYDPFYHTKLYILFYFKPTSEVYTVAVLVLDVNESKTAKVGHHPAA